MTKLYKFLKFTTISILLITTVPITKVVAQNLVFPEPTNYVSDFANVISASTENELNTTLSQFEQETSHQIFVVSVKDYQGTYLEDFAVKLFEEWGIGQKDKDNGILLLFQPEAPSGSRVRIEVGYGLEGAVPDSVAGRILDNYFMDSYFDKDYDLAVKSTVAELIIATEGEYEGAGVDGVYIDEAFNWASIALFFFFIFWSMLASTKSWWLGGLLGFIVGIFLGWNWLGWLGVFIIPWPLLIVGLIFDFIASKIGITSTRRGIWTGGGFSSSGGFGGGGFSGGGGGGSGGGGASR